MVHIGMVVYNDGYHSDIPAYIFDNGLIILGELYYNDPSNGDYVKIFEPGQIGESDSGDIVPYEITPSNVTSVCILENIDYYYYEFSGFTNLEKVSIPDNIARYQNQVPQAAFKNCVKLERFKVPNGTDSIGTEAFSGCTRLSAIYIPASMSYIESDAFANCSAITDVYYGGTQAEWTSLMESYPIAEFDSATIHYEFNSANWVERGFETVLGTAVLDFLVKSAKERSDYKNTIEEQNTLMDDMQSDIEDKDNEIEYQNSQLNSLQTDYNDLSSEYYQLRDDYYDLERENRGLHSENVSLRSLVNAGWTNNGQSEEELTDQSKIYHSINFDDFNTWLHYHLVPTERPSIVPPEPKLSFVSVPGADGDLDFTEALDNKIHYNQRTGDWTFYVHHESIESYDWTELWQRMLEDLHGKFFKVSLSDEEKIGPWYYFGRIWLDEWQSDPSHSKVVIKYNLEPFRYPSVEAYEAREGGSL